MAHSNWIIWEGLVRGLFAKMWAGCREITKDSVAAWRIAMGSLRCHGGSRLSKLGDREFSGEGHQPGPRSRETRPVCVTWAGSQGSQHPLLNLSLSPLGEPIQKPKNQGANQYE